MPACAGLLCRELSGLAHGGRYAQSRYITGSATPRAPWRVAAPSPPSIHPRPHAETDDAPSLSEQLRAVMRLVPHSVVVCTSVFSPPTTAGAAAPEPRGMTMSSFTSLTLRPVPVVTFNIATPSRTLDALTSSSSSSSSSSRAFHVHVLSGDAEGARVAEWFRRGNAAGLGVFDAARMREGCGCEVVAVGGAAGEEENEKQQEQAPLLRGRGVLYVLRCRVLDEGPMKGLIQVRDHVVVLAEVVDIIEGEGGAAAAGNDERFGLAYADRKYRQLGGTLVNEED